MEIAYCAGAADAAGTDWEELDTPDTTAEQLVSLLNARHDGLSGVLESCALLVDGSPAKDPQMRILAGSRVDVLPRSLVGNPVFTML